MIARGRAREQRFVSREREGKLKKHSGQCGQPYSQISPVPTHSVTLPWPMATARPPTHANGRS